jgi:hypothetical protein
MSAQSPGTVVNAGGKDPDQDKIDKMCEAFKAAITEFCSSAAKGVNPPFMPALMQSCAA